MDGDRHRGADTAANAVRYPEMRAEIVDAVRCLSDPEYQQRVWIEHRYPTPTYVDNLSENVHLAHPRWPDVVRHAAEAYR